MPERVQIHINKCCASLAPVIGHSLLVASQLSRVDFACAGAYEIRTLWLEYSKFVNLVVRPLRPALRVDLSDARRGQVMCASEGGIQLADGKAATDRHESASQSHALMSVQRVRARRNLLKVLHTSPIASLDDEQVYSDLQMPG
jgi:hypothetical protein